MDLTFQVGVDIATALSIAGATGLFLWNQFRQNSKNKKDQEHRTFREQKFRMIETLGDFVRVYCDKNASFRRNANLGERPDVNDLLQECQRIVNYCQYFASPVFNSFAAKRELEVISEIKGKILAWNAELVEGHLSNNPSLINYEAPAKIVAEGISELLKE